jgi:hypothetical protein
MNVPSSVAEIARNGGSRSVNTQTRSDINKKRVFFSSLYLKPVPQPEKKKRAVRGNVPLPKNREIFYQLSIMALLSRCC